MPEQNVTNSPYLDTDLQAFDAIPAQAAAIRERLSHAIVGQDEAVQLLTLALLTQGHTLMIGVPGLAKTLLVRALADALGWSFSRIQFTPDMMPADVIGSEIIQVDPETGQRQLSYQPGPIFANLLLADEINRTPPRTQAALLEAMAERQITVAGQSRLLPDPFVVVATQNPIEQEGTYPLPEAQLDRFMFSLQIRYPEQADELAIIRDYLPGGAHQQPTETQATEAPVMSIDACRRAASLITQMPLPEPVVESIAALVRATRPDAPDASDQVRHYVAWGAGPRAGQFLALAARALAATEGEPTPHLDHIRRLAPAILRHRIILNYAATGDDITPDQIIAALLAKM